MKSIVTVNTQLPSVDDIIFYNSDRSLIDYDIILFDPRLGYYPRIEFAGGGSCIEIESGRRLIGSMQHWRQEMQNALEAGKTVFFLLDSLTEESIATGSTTPRKNERLYQTNRVTNYDVLPVTLKFRNAKGNHCKVIDSRFQGLFAAIEPFFEYRVLLSASLTKKVFSTKNGKEALGGLVNLKTMPGHLVLVPYFDVPESTTMVDEEEVWTDETLRSSNMIVGQLVEIDRVLRCGADITPVPDWIEQIEKPKDIEKYDELIQGFDTKITQIEFERSEISIQRENLFRFFDLMYENGPRLEDAVSASLKILGYDVENFRDGDLEIDHLIISPSGVRMIGESEGKDNSPIGIKKFRQLSSNIQEDFSREGVAEPAKGILFGNGFRLSEPSTRDAEFTEKCLKNAKLLGVALVRTSDLYKAVRHLLDDPEDHEFRTRCRNAIEQAAGEIVIFPTGNLT